MTPPFPGQFVIFHRVDRRRIIGFLLGEERQAVQEDAVIPHTRIAEQLCQLRPDFVVALLVFGSTAFLYMHYKSKSLH